jgi:TM2 domain-containing membrane protein YozV
MEKGKMKNLVVVVNFLLGIVVAIFLIMGFGFVKFQLWRENKNVTK